MLDGDGANCESPNMDHEIADYMEMALSTAGIAGNRGEVPVGAIIVDTASGRIVANSGNQMVGRSDPTAHAEMLALRAAGNMIGSQRLIDCDMYVTLEPCPMCAAAISLARIRRLYFGAYDPKGGGVEYGARIFDQTSCHHRPEIYGGLQESKSAALLKNFFETRR